MNTILRPVNSSWNNHFRDINLEDVGLKKLIMFNLEKRRIVFQMQLYERDMFSLARRIKSEPIGESYKERDYDPLKGRTFLKS